MRIEWELMRDGTGGTAGRVLHALAGGEQSIPEIVTIVTSATSDAPASNPGEGCLLAVLYNLQAKRRLTSRLTFSDGTFTRRFRTPTTFAPTPNSDTPAAPKKWRDIVDRAALPADVANLIETVIHQAGLTRKESADLAIDLVSFFHAQLTPGRPASQVITAFGKPWLVSTLIRRAKLRARPWLWHAISRLPQALALLLLLDILLGVWMVYHKPAMHHDYAAELNAAALGTPVEQHAWPIYREAFAKQDPETFKEFIPDLDFVEHTDLHQVESFLKRNAELIEAARRGALKPHLGLAQCPEYKYAAEDWTVIQNVTGTPRAARPPRLLDDADVVASGAVENCGFYSCGMMRCMATRLALDLRAAADRGDGDRVVLDSEAIVGLIRQQLDDDRVISYLVAVSMIRLENAALLDVMLHRSSALTERQLEALAHCVQQTTPMNVCPTSGFERDVLDKIQRVYSDDRWGGSVITWAGAEGFFRNDQSKPQEDPPRWLWIPILPIINAVTVSRDEVTAEIRRIFAVHHDERQIWQVVAPSAFEVEVRRLHARKDAFRYWPLLLRLVPSRENDLVTTVHQGGAVSRAIGDLLGVVLAIERFRRAHGEYPQALKQLVPRFLNAEPVDHSTGAPLLYRIKDGKPLLYGRGRNAKDDGGVSIPGPEDWRAFWPYPIPENGDWILYPPIKILPPVPTTQATRLPPESERSRAYSLEEALAPRPILNRPAP